MKRVVRALNNSATFAFIGVLCMIISGCASRPSCESVEATVKAATQADESYEAIDRALVEQRWQAGVHADSFVVSATGVNSSCARCHAPLAWQPLQDELPMRWASLNLSGLRTGQKIAEAQWPQIGCKVCHPGEHEQGNREIALLDVAPLDLYIEVRSSSHLCRQCHLSVVEGEHVPLVIGGVHEELECSDCHDVHDGAATCGESSCHQTFAQECIPIETHDKPHASITCWGCHDGLQLPIGWNEDKEMWDTFFGGDPRNEPSARPIASHSLTLKVDCDRCHAPGDHPWDPT